MGRNHAAMPKVWEECVLCRAGKRIRICTEILGFTVYLQVKATGKTWHKGCLRCIECSTLLDSKRLTEKDGDPLCHRCYGKVGYSSWTILDGDWIGLTVFIYSFISFMAPRGVAMRYSAKQGLSLAEWLRTGSNYHYVLMLCML